eukprot:UN30382
MGKSTKHYLVCLAGLPHIYDLPNTGFQTQLQHNLYVFDSTGERLQKIKLLNNKWIEIISICCWTLNYKQSKTSAVRSIKNQPRVAITWLDKAENKFMLSIHDFKNYNGKIEFEHRHSSALGCVPYSILHCNF